MDRLIEDYEIQLVEPACAPGAGRWGALARTASDIANSQKTANAQAKQAKRQNE